MRDIKFVKYTGAYPNLCSGTVFLEVDGEPVVIQPYHLTSGGSCGWDPEYIDRGPWTLKRPKGMLEWDAFVLPQETRFTEEELDYIEHLINENVEHGCCGGCI